MTKTGWLSEIPEMEREAEDHELRARALRQMIEAVRVLNGHAAEVSDPLFVSQNGKMFVAQPLDRFGPARWQRPPDCLEMHYDDDRMGTGVRRKDVPATDDMSVARVRGLLEQTFARFGYARVPDPGQPPDMQVRLLHEFARLLARNENVLSRADTRPKLARAFGDILAAAKAKVAHDREWAARYAEERTAESADMVRSAGRVPADWKDL